MITSIMRDRGVAREGNLIVIAATRKQARAIMLRLLKTYKPMRKVP